MSKTGQIMLWCLAVAGAAAAVRARAQGSDEYVVSAIACQVTDPKDLGAELGLRKGHKIVVETLNTGYSTFFIEGEAYLTGFPAALRFSQNRFIVAGTERWDESRQISLRIEGRVENPQDGYLWFDFRDAANRRMAIADLDQCVRRR